MDGTEWVGGRSSTQLYITEGEPYRPDLVLWVDAGAHTILSSRADPLLGRGTSGYAPRPHLMSGDRRCAGGSGNAHPQPEFRAARRHSRINAARDQEARLGSRRPHCLPASDVHRARYGSPATHGAGCPSGQRGGPSAGPILPCSSRPTERPRARSSDRGVIPVQPRTPVAEDAKPFDCSRDAVRDPRETKGLAHDLTTQSGNACNGNGSCC